MKPQRSPVELRQLLETFFQTPDGSLLDQIRQFRKEILALLETDRGVEIDKIIAASNPDPFLIAQFHHALAGEERLQTSVSDALAQFERDDEEEEVIIAQA